MNKSKAAAIITTMWESARKLALLQREGIEHEMS